MNQQLIIDEGSRNTMSLKELEQRIEQWLEDGREAVIVERLEDVIGYLLFFREIDERYPYAETIYVRQFFIHPSYRRRGIGQLAFEQIVDGFFSKGIAITLDVLESNPEGKAFWQKMGFEV